MPGETADPDEGMQLANLNIECFFFALQLN